MSKKQPSLDEVRAHRAILELAVVREPDPVVGKEPVALAAVKEESTTDTELLGLRQGATSPLQAPMKVRLIEALPRIAVGQDCEAEAT